MFCKYCGKEIEEGKDVCIECDTKETKVEAVKVEEQKQEVVVEAPKAENNNTSTNGNTNNVNTNSNQVVNQKSKIAAGLFGIFLGAFGVHNFYLGFTGKAVAQLLITILSCGCLSFVSGIWGLIEGILILAGDSSKDAYGNDLKD